MFQKLHLQLVQWSQKKFTSTNDYVGIDYIDMDKYFGTSSDIEQEFGSWCTNTIHYFSYIFPKILIEILKFLLKIKNANDR